MGERRARLFEESVHNADTAAEGWLRFTARNGQIIMAGEIVSRVKRARESAVRGMVDVVVDDPAGRALVIEALRAAGAEITWPTECSICSATFNGPSAYDSEDRCPECCEFYG
jgi:hypothetical protein